MGKGLVNGNPFDFTDEDLGVLRYFKAGDLCDRVCTLTYDLRVYRAPLGIEDDG